MCECIFFTLFKHVYFIMDIENGKKYEWVCNRSQISEGHSPTGICTLFWRFPPLTANLCLSIIHQSVSFSISLLKYDPLYFPSSCSLPSLSVNRFSIRWLLDTERNVICWLMAGCSGCTQKYTFFLKNISFFKLETVAYIVRRYVSTDSYNSSYICIKLFILFLRMWSYHPPTPAFLTTGSG